MKANTLPANDLVQALVNAVNAFVDCDRQFSAHGHYSYGATMDSTASPRRAARLGGDRILSRFGENDLVKRQRVGDHGVIDTAHGVAFVIEDVVADRELAVEQVEANLARHPPEVALG